MKVELKEAIRASFSAHATTYDLAAAVHRRAASILFEQIIRQSHLSAQGVVLEIGCGTGNLSFYLHEHFQERQCVFVDLSEPMLAQCQLRLGTNSPSPLRQFIAADAEQLHNHDAMQGKQVALIASSFTFQWFEHFELVLARLLNLLAPGGELYFAFPARGSFPEWRQIADSAHLAVTANPLPGMSELVNVSKQNDCRLEVEELSLIDHFDNSYSFFQALKKLGATACVNGTHQSPPTLRRLMRQWDSASAGGIEATYKVLFGVLRK